MTDSNLPATTPSQTVGPFFHLGLKSAAGESMQPLGAGERIRLRIIVTDGNALPVPDALVELWAHNGGDAAAFGRVATTGDGRCELDAVRPPPARDGAASPKAAHIDVCLFARGLLRQLHTRIYFAGDQRLDHDPVLALVPDDRRRTLLARPDETVPGLWVFRLRLQGADETVFFDI